MSLGEKLKKITEEDALAEEIQARRLAEREAAQYRAKIAANIKLVNDLFETLFGEVEQAVMDKRLPSKLKVSGFGGVRGLLTGGGQECLWGTEPINPAKIQKGLTILEGTLETLQKWQAKLRQEGLALQIEYGHDGCGMSDWYYLYLVPHEHRRYREAEIPRGPHQTRR